MFLQNVLTVKFKLYHALVLKYALPSSKRHNISQTDQNLVYNGMLTPPPNKNNLPQNWSLPPNPGIFTHPPPTLTHPLS